MNECRKKEITQGRKAGKDSGKMVRESRTSGKERTKAVKK